MRSTSDQTAGAGPSSSNEHVPSQAQIVQGLCTGVLSQYEVSHTGLSQYSGSGGVGVSACGLAALNCARVILGKDQSGTKGENLLHEMMQVETVQEILQACTMWTGTAHLDVEDIYRSPAFRKCLKLESSDFGHPDAKHFKSMLRMLKNISHRRGKMACAIVTRPPEIISCLFIPDLKKDMFVIFDSHPRPQLELKGASFIFNTSIDDTAIYLAELLAVDSNLLDDGVQWQAQLLHNFSSHIFTSRISSAGGLDWSNQDALTSSMEILSLRAECLGLRTRCSTLTDENQKLQGEIAALQRRVELERELSRSLLLRRPTTSHTIPTVELVEHPRPLVGSSPSPNDTSLLEIPPAPRRQDTPNPQDIPSPPSTPGTNSTSDSAPEMRHYRLGLLNSSEDGINQEDLEFALLQQRIFDEESRQMDAERGKLAASGQGTFQCRVCFEDHSREFVAQIPGCDHCFCRDCILAHVVSQIDAHRYPIFCPLCSADRRNRNPVALSNEFVQDLGLSEQQFTRFVEMEMASFSLPLHCRSCDKTFFVDREEFNEATLIECPLPGCNSTWCKACNRVVDNRGSPHSCDGSAELNHLMRQEGWKNCPGCQTPIEKINGCNHMTCSTPGCNTHFCYLCGRSIVQSRSRLEIDAAIADHYSQCRLIDDIPDQVLPQAQIRHPYRNLGVFQHRLEVNIGR